MTFMAAASSANALIINYEDGTAQNTSGLSTYTTTDEAMYGMTATVTLSDSTSYTYIWSYINSDTSGFSFYDEDDTYYGSLSLSGDSWSNSWNLDVTDDDFEIASIFIGAGAGNSVFDVIYEPVGSTNSARGWAFNSSYSGDLTVTYSGIVSVGDDDAVGDLYRYLLLDFGDDYFGSNDTLKFWADTDTLAIAGDINPVPEPSTILLLGLGITGLIGLKRKQNSNK
jgi:hypothetical protein